MPSSFVRSFGVSLVLVAVGLWATPEEARAQSASASEPNTVTVTPFVSTGFGASDDLTASIGLGGGVTYDVTRRLGFEGEISHVFDIIGNDPNVDLSMTNYSGNGVFNFPLPRVTPYATFGIGVEHAGVHVKTPDPAATYPASSTEVSYNFGGGVKYPVSERFVIRGDIRRFLASDLAPDYWRLYGGVSWWIKR